MIKIISRLNGLAYQKVIKPVVFRIDPELVHDSTLNLAHISGKIASVKYLLSKSLAYQNEMLSQEIDGINYKNPIGLAAGWDKDAKAIEIMPSLGFGFSEVGSITKHGYKGNESPRLKRLPASRSILVNYGLKNDGVDLIAPRIPNRAGIALGTNIARTNTPDCADDNVSIEDYAYSFAKLAHIGDYFTINVSCPNTYGGQPFHDKERLELLLKRLDSISTSKPVYIKLSPDIDKETRKNIADLSFKYRVNGFLCGNLTKNHKLDTIKDEIGDSLGGMSGKVLQQISDDLIADMYKYTSGDKTIIGLGGVFNADDAYRKIKLGASLVQLITGLIYQGPQVVGQINYDLVELLKKDGYQNIKQAIGRGI